MLRVLPFVVLLGFTVYCLIDVLSTDRRDFRSLGKPVWILAVLVPVIGAVLWLKVGRAQLAPRPGVRGKPGRRGGGVVAPDDNPDFLREVDRRTWRTKRQGDPPTPRDSEDDHPTDGPAPHAA